MESTTWQEIERLFHAASERPRGEQRAFLERETDDVELLERVVAMLDITEEGHALRVERRLLGADESWVATQRIGEKIGAYELVELLGRGGMGDVYLARRDDPDIEHEVAIKLLRTSAMSPESLARFRSERRILARLSHPDIVGYIDSGMTGEGQPYLVMPVVRGAPITAYCESRRLDVPQRLDLFRRVCEAVQFAHQNLIVHRDIKPSNALVSEDGEVRLLDFGIAKIMSDEDGTTVITRTDVRAMTPEYASPEQIRGEPITTAVDVYGLGLLLYEMLTRENPQRVTDGSRADVERAICDTSPPPMREALDNPPRALLGDLQTIVDMALRKEPERRYRTAGELAEDIERFQRGLPVRARPDTWRYRLGKFTARHRVAVASTVLVVVALVSVAGIALHQSQTAARERDTARVERDRAQQVTRMFVDVLGRVNPVWNPQADSLLASELLSQNEARIFEGLAEDPAVATELAVLYAKVYMHQRKFARANSMLQRATDFAISAFGSNSPDALNVNHMRAVMAHQVGDPRAPDMLWNSYERVVSVFGEHSKNAAQILTQVAATRPWPERLELTLRSLDIRLRACGDDVTCLGTGYRAVAEAYLDRDSLDAAIGAYPIAIETYLGADPPNERVILSAEFDLGRALTAAGYVAAADTALRVAIARSRDLDPKLTARTRGLIGLNFLTAGEPDSARIYTERSLAELRELYGETHHHVARAWERCAQVAYHRGDYAEALRLLDRSHRILVGEPRRSHLFAALIRARVAMAQGSPGGSVDSVRVLRNAIVERWPDAEVAYRAEFVLGLAHLREGDADSAVAAFERTRAFYAVRGSHREARMREAELALTLAAGESVHPGGYARWSRADPVLIALANRNNGTRP